MILSIQNVPYPENHAMVMSQNNYKHCLWLESKNMILELPWPAFRSLGNMLYIMIPGETSGDQYCSLDIPQAYDSLNELRKPLQNASLSTVCLH